jgi:hypothetical protein
MPTNHSSRRDRNISAKGHNTPVNGAQDVYVASECRDITANQSAFRYSHIAAKGEQLVNRLARADYDVTPGAEAVAALIPGSGGRSGS